MCAPLWGKQDSNKYYGAYCTDIMPASKADGHFLKSYFDDEDFDKDEYLKEMKKVTNVTYDYLIMNDFTLPLNKDNEVEKKEELVKLLKESVFKTVNHDTNVHGHTDKNLTIDNSTVEFYSEDMSNI